MRTRATASIMLPIVKYLLLLLAVRTTQTHAFWWPKTTTEAPTTVLEQIPLTYFRTYTYQPLAGAPFGFAPFGFGFGAAQTPLLGNARYDNFGSSYASALHEPALKSHAVKIDGTLQPLLRAGPTASAASASSSTTTTTTSTTTTTPAPTTTSTTPKTTTSSSTSTTTTTALPLPPDYPAYNRRWYAANSGGNGFGGYYAARPQYPYPDYFNYQPSLGASSKSGSRIQFVPCMCPVSVSLSGLAASTNAAGGTLDGSVQARNVDEEEQDDLELAHATEPELNPNSFSDFSASASASASASSSSSSSSTVAASSVPAASTAAVTKPRVIIEALPTIATSMDPSATHVAADAESLDGADQPNFDILLPADIKLDDTLALGV